MTVTILIFAKFPEPGRVKTRLCPVLTPEQAADLHRAALSVVCEWAATHAEYRMRLVVTPDESAAAFAAMTGGRFEIWPQGGGDLGERMLRAARRVLDRGEQAAGARDDRVIFLGADSPALPRDTLRDAVARLNEADAVVGPCEDGGYYLLGMRNLEQTLLEGIEWGGPRVLAQTLAAARGAGLRLVELPCAYDVDRPEDLARAAKDLRRNGATAPAMALADMIDGWLDVSS